MHLSPTFLILAFAAAPVALVASAEQAAPPEDNPLVARVDGSWAITAFVAERRPPLAIATDDLVSDGQDGRSEGQRRRQAEDELQAEEAFEDAVQAMRDGGQPN